MACQPYCAAPCCAMFDQPYSAALFLQCDGSTGVQPQIFQGTNPDVGHVADFRLQPEGSQALAVAFDNLDVYGSKPGWTAKECAGQLTDWLIEETLMPLHVAPKEFKRRIESFVASVIVGLPAMRVNGDRAGL